MQGDKNINAANIVIRRALAADAETLRDFERNIITAERPFDPTIKSGDIAYYDLPRLIDMDEAFVALAEADGAPIGCGFARKTPSRAFTEPPFHAYVGLMYVAPSYRGRGVAGAIVARLSEWARENGLTEMRLEVYPDNERAVRAYDAAGFTPYMLEMRRELKG